MTKDDRLILKAKIHEKKLIDPIDVIDTIFELGYKIIPPHKPIEEWEQWAIMEASCK